MIMGILKEEFECPYCGTEYDQVYCDNNVFAKMKNSYDNLSFYHVRCDNCMAIIKLSIQTFYNIYVPEEDVIDRVEFYVTWKNTKAASLRINKAMKNTSARWEALDGIPFLSEDKWNGIINIASEEVESWIKIAKPITIREQDNIEDNT